MRRLPQTTCSTAPGTCRAEKSISTRTCTTNAQFTQSGLECSVGSGIDVLHRIARDIRSLPEIRLPSR
jgi:hypothetical protein